MCFSIIFPLIITNSTVLKCRERDVIGHDTIRPGEAVSATRFKGESGCKKGDVKLWFGKPCCFPCSLCLLSLIAIYVRHSSIYYSLSFCIFVDMSAQ